MTTPLTPDEFADKLKEVLETIEKATEASDAKDPEKARELFTKAGKMLEDLGYEPDWPAKP
jgi:ABC-type nitrate/sulfonate/bicarbonate transport system substrate-binding protein